MGSASRISFAHGRFNDNVRPAVNRRSPGAGADPLGGFFAIHAENLPVQAERSIAG
jgi:hypothetical protein